ncbi:glycosyltransferase family 4 protein [Pseudoflavitalea sp. X16]|uniref:glycosyltransferase n=1 Tax=Paraflavitalea devenefica TaxID=2716334 RepID=UPI00142368FF|nr:glycosyltransferase [Paraflavitalea devenefica]NII24082.1 glycosyltransferase family 4 protein [Paraflavitalea devenefica]
MGKFDGKMKRVLIIAPHFPPVNSADMHRVRQSLPYFREMGWEPVIITVDERYIESYSIDPLLSHTFPADIEVHKVKAFDVRYTRKLGLGSLSIRSYFQIKRKGNELLKKHKFDLVYFSTTAFHVMALGPGWKRKFGVPFILDIQDPWRSDFYLDKPRSERPPKFFISYNIDKYLEGKTVPKANGIISVSQGYCDMFLQRYTGMQKEQFRVIPFGVSGKDFSVMEKYVQEVDKINFSTDRTNIVYVGRGGHDLKFALEIIFRALAKGIERMPEVFGKVHLWFVGTSYAQAGKGQKTIEPLARALQVGDYVTEIPDRLPYFETLFLLKKKADMLLVPGSTDTSYTASKIYPYIITQKTLLAVFYRESSVLKVLKEVYPQSVLAFDHLHHSPEEYVDACMEQFKTLLSSLEAVPVNMPAFEPYMAKQRTKEQVEFFNKVINGFRN